MATLAQTNQTLLDEHFQFQIGGPCRYKSFVLYIKGKIYIIKVLRIFLKLHVLLFAKSHINKYTFFANFLPIQRYLSIYKSIYLYIHLSINNIDRSIEYLSIRLSSFSVKLTNYLLSIYVSI